MRTILGFWVYIGDLIVIHPPRGLGVGKGLGSGVFRGRRVCEDAGVSQHRPFLSPKPLYKDYPFGILVFGRLTQLMLEFNLSVPVYQIVIRHMR